jgi:rubredoxin
MHLGLDYDRNTMLFSIKSYDNIEKVIDEVSDIFKDEVVFLQNCIRCKKPFACKGCSYIESCTTKNLPFSCVCPSCLRDSKQFEESLAGF